MLVDKIPTIKISVFVKCNYKPGANPINISDLNLFPFHSLEISFTTLGNCLDYKKNVCAHFLKTDLSSSLGKKCTLIQQWFWLHKESKFTKKALLPTGTGSISKSY